MPVCRTSNSCSAAGGKRALGTTVFDGHCGRLTVVSHSVLVSLLIVTLHLPNNVLQITTKGKDRHYIILHGAADDDSRFIDVHFEWPGCVHDTRFLFFFFQFLSLKT